MARRGNGFTSHDVRRLHLCSECGEIGAVGVELANRINAPLVMTTGRQQWAHPRCMRIEHLVLLSREQLGEIRLCDVDPHTMETILLAFRNGLSQGWR
jgi:hypothetical protein